MKTITATVVWSVNVKIQVSDNATTEQKQDAIYAAAHKAELDLKHPIIHDCSDPDCID
jgi:hypothetical protein